jgi:rhamnosyltransferase
MAAPEMRPGAGVPGLGGRQLPLTVSVVVPLKNGGSLFRHLATHLALQQTRWGIEVIIVDSGSTDGSVETARAFGFIVECIPPETFGHGRTRNLGIRRATGEVVCMITHDVLPCTPDWPWVFATHFADDPEVAGVFGRQVPRNADTPEMHFIAVNYPDAPRRYGPVPGGQIPGFGTVLFSDAFSALRRRLALEIPYIDDIPVSEDQVWARQVTAMGYSVVYEPRAEALHAHRYTFAQLYKRCFLVGQAGEPFGILAGTSTASGIGVLWRELRYFISHGHTHWLPWLLVYEFVRWLGYQRGRRSGWRPATMPAVLATPPRVLRVAQ